MSQDIDRELEEVWMPHLIKAWRTLVGKSGSGERLSAREVESVGEAVRVLSGGLVGERELIGTPYMDEAAKLGAYLLYFWPVSYAQGRRVLRELGAERVRGHVVDLGGGPGPMAFAALDEGASSAHLMERSQSALQAALGMAREHGFELTGVRSDLQRAQEWPVADGMIMGHALGELWCGGEERIEQRAALCEAWLERLRPQGWLVLIEPALRETSRELLQVRDVLVERGHEIFAPCLRAGGCPALERERDWCHSERAWTPPRVVSQIMSAAGLKRRTLKMSYLILCPDQHSARDEQVFRIVSEPLHTKGRYHHVACGEAGRHGVTLLSRQKGRMAKVFKKLERGDVVRLQGLEERGDGLRLGAKFGVERVCKVGEPPPCGEAE